MGRLGLLVTLAATLAAATAATAAPPARWPERLLLRESLAQRISSQVVSAGSVAFLVSATESPVRGPYRLERVDLATGAVVRGARFPVGSVALAAGRLWVYGSTRTRARIFEVDPRRLEPVREIPLPRGGPLGLPPHVTAGPSGSVWVAAAATLLRVDASTGSVVARASLAPQLAVADVELAPDGRRLYASATSVERGGGVLFELSPTSGRPLAAATTGPITWSVAGAALTAVPGGVWASFRTGLLGMTIHFRESDLTLGPPSVEPTSPANGVFHWPMDATTVYGGGVLWLANEAGWVACVDPVGGMVRARERVAQSSLLSLVAFDETARAPIALDRDRLVLLVPPARCRR